LSLFYFSGHVDVKLLHQTFQVVGPEYCVFPDLQELHRLEKDVRRFFVGVYVLLRTLAEISPDDMI